MSLDKITVITKLVILINIFLTIAFTLTMGYLTKGVATVSWQIYLFSLLHPEVPFILGMAICRFITNIECGRYVNDD